MKDGAVEGASRTRREERLRQYDAWLKLEYQDLEARVYSVREPTSGTADGGKWKGPLSQSHPDRRKPKNSAAQAPSMITMIRG